MAFSSGATECVPGSVGTSSQHSQSSARALFPLRHISEIEFQQAIRAEITGVGSWNVSPDWIGFDGGVIGSGGPIKRNRRIRHMIPVANAIILHAWPI